MVWTPREALVVQSAAAVTGGMIRRVLSQLGFTVLVAADFAAAKRRLATRPPHLLVADLRLGAYNGLHLVFSGKATKPELAAILVGDRSDRGMRADAEEAGATFLTEPLQSDALAAAVRKLMPLIEGNGQAEPGAATLAGNEGEAHPFAKRRDSQRRFAVEDVGPFVRANDLHGRLEEKRQHIERERRGAMRRRSDRKPAGPENPDD
jgi:DNA-binding response OmpR family regulator